MPYFIMLALGYLSRFLPALIVRALASLGYGLASYAALSSVFGAMKVYVDGFIGGLPGDIFKSLDTFGLIWCINFWLACVAARVAWKATSVFVKKV